MLAAYQKALMVPSALGLKLHGCNVYLRLSILILRHARFQYISERPLKSQGGLVAFLGTATDC